MTTYETWSELQDVFRPPITRTDAPVGMRLVNAEEYDKLRKAWHSYVDFMREKYGKDFQ